MRSSESDLAKHIKTLDKRTINCLNLKIFTRVKMLENFVTVEIGEEETKVKTN